MNITERELKYLGLLSKQYPTVASAASEIINLRAILNLPKGTEHFLADIHGEYEAFIHVLKNASGTIRVKVENLFLGQIREQELRQLCTLIYYPKESLERLGQQDHLSKDWYKVTLNQLIKVLQCVSEKYTRSKVRKALPSQYSYITQELTHEDSMNPKKSAYVGAILDTIIDTGQADDFIIAISETIQRLAIDRLHIVGDVFDRGPGAQFIMDKLLTYHNVDIQWGNHDMLWMGAAVGNTASMANAIRIALRYANLSTLENGYGINMLPLARLAMEVYGKDPCTPFTPKLGDADETYDEKSILLMGQMHKAIAIIQFKLEQQIIARHPEYKMEERNLLHRINQADGSITLPDGNTYPLKDTFFPTIDPNDPYTLTEGEADVVAKLLHSFRHSEKLLRHINFLFKKGSMYLCCNRNLLFHASVPLNEDKTFRKVMIQGKAYSGRALLDRIDELVRESHWSSSEHPEHQDAIDYIWYLWCGPDSPLFDKSAMTTFERYFIADKATHHEEKGYYYVYRTEEKVCEMILEEFGLKSSESHIINGHVPVREVKGEHPVQAGGKIMLIDGGFSRAYQSSTGIAGYTLIFNSQGLHLVKHEPFSSTREAIEHMEDISSTSVVKAYATDRILVRDTDQGLILEDQIEELKKLLYAYRHGMIKERE